MSTRFVGPVPHRKPEVRPDHPAVEGDERWCKVKCRRTIKVVRTRESGRSMYQCYVDAARKVLPDWCNPFNEADVVRFATQLWRNA